MDAVDSQILGLLMTDGRMTWAELATRIGLSSSSAVERVRKLEKRGVLERYEARVNPAAVGCHLLAFVSIGLSEPSDRENVLEWARGSEHVQECHAIAGPYDYLVKLRCRNTEEYEAILREQIRGIPGVARTDTTIVLVTRKETLQVPLAG
jgi:Lrp/AsnC family leucine-responsive transcriptional regulator